jgi:hypothetical protein
MALTCFRVLSVVLSAAVLSQSPSAASTILSTYNIVPTPPLNLDFYSVIPTLNSITCNDLPLTTSTPTTIIPLLGPSRLSQLINPVLSFHSNAQPDLAPLSYTPTEALAALVETELNNDLTMCYMSDALIDSQYYNVSVTIDYDRHFIVPTFLTSVVLTYNPQISPSVKLNSSVELVLDFYTLALIFTAK